MLVVLASHRTRLGLHQRLWRAYRGSHGQAACERLVPCRFQARSHQRLSLARRVGAGGGRGGLELDQYVARADGLPIRHEDALNDTHFGRLDHLGFIRGDDLARCDGDEIDLADARPAEGKGERRDDGPHNGARQRRRRRLDELERRREEFAF